MSLEKYKLVYFNFGTRGRGESVKLLLEDAGVPHEYELIDRDAWEPVKQKLIDEGHPCACVPYLEADGKKYFASTAILRFLSKKFGKYRGSNDDEEQFVDACADFVDDWYYAHLRKWLNPTDEVLKEDYEKNQAPKHFARFERIYGANQGPYILGSEISYADFMVFHTIDDQWRTQKLKEYPNLAKFIEAFSARPNMTKYLTVAPPKTD
ncbi:glutathione S-transferase [Zychaea mexicana]|uniref:glutathione S-transferase n=1 Tax=Zychaea mexicana TaxID=64656 RepID=UPI0022FE6638|nr:glutathione S-transferase [Zychaea mexicana]KAI9495008.1 glutathione S-transferase [Zychaea mexicana]